MLISIPTIHAWRLLAVSTAAAVTDRRVLLAFALTVAFALCARWLRAVTLSGMAAGAILAFILYLAGGAGLFTTLLMVFILTFATTRLGYWHKQRLGIAERQTGRSASQVFANIAVAAGMGVLALVAEHSEGWLIAACAAMAEAAADTVSSEFGQAVSRRAYLITDFRPVPVGTDGGISLRGTLGGVAAALITCGVAAGTRVLPVVWLLPCAGVAVVGMFVDSFLGALLERHDLLNNDAVNFASTALTAVFTIFLYWSRHGQYWLT